VWPEIELDHAKVRVEVPVVVTCPYQISSSAPIDPSNCSALVQEVTPPPDSDDKVTLVVPTWAKTSSTSPTV
jgi:hypothetical protein